MTENKLGSFPAEAAQLIENSAQLIENSAQLIENSTQLIENSAQLIENSTQLPCIGWVEFLSEQLNSKRSIVAIDTIDTIELWGQVVFRCIDKL